MQSKVVKPKRGHKYFGQASDWDIVLKFNWHDIPKGLPLSARALSHWKQKKKPPFYYVDFKSLRHSDIISVLSCAQNRRQTVLQIDRQGRIAFYKVVDNCT